jgi:hypothetical protein
MNTEGASSKTTPFAMQKFSGEEDEDRPEIASKNTTPFKSIHPQDGEPILVKKKTLKLKKK